MKIKRFKKMIFIVLIFFIGIGFAVITSNLTMNANFAFTESSFNLHFEKIETLNTSTVTSPTATIINETSISFNGTFNAPGDYIEFSFYIVNSGTIDGQINLISTNLTEEQKNYIDYNFKYDIDKSVVNLNDIIYAGQARKIIAHFEYKEDIDEFIDLSSLNLNLNIKFIQPQAVNSLVWNYEYLNAEQYFIVPKAGKYKLEVWGSSGGSAWSGVPGKGGYATGEININKNQKIYITVGGKTTGSDTIGCGGGGATYIALDSGNLKTFESKLNRLLIVAGGGGGAERTAGGCGGGYIGGNGTNSATYPSYGEGGTQSTGGIGHADPNKPPYYNINGIFGYGGVGTASDSGCGGGSGLYGGGASTYAGGAGGGSGYIGNLNLSNKIMYCYNCQSSEEEADETNIKTRSTSNASETATSNYAKIGNGFVKITLVN